MMLHYITIHVHTCIYMYTLTHMKINHIYMYMYHCMLQMMSWRNDAPLYTCIYMYMYTLTHMKINHIYNMYHYMLQMMSWRHDVMVLHYITIYVHTCIYMYTLTHMKINHIMYMYDCMLFVLLSGCQTMVWFWKEFISFCQVSKRTKRTTSIQSYFWFWSKWNILLDWHKCKVCSPTCYYNNLTFKASWLNSLVGKVGEEYNENTCTCIYLYI